MAKWGGHRENLRNAALLNRQGTQQAWKRQLITGRSALNNTTNYTTQPTASPFFPSPPPPNRLPQTTRTRTANLGHRLNEQQ